MDRRSFFKSAAVAGAATATGLASPAIAQGRRELAMVTSWPKNFPGLGTAAEKFAEMIGTATDGRYRVRVYGGGELVHALKAHDAVEQGTAVLYHSADYYYGGKADAYPFFCTVPMGFIPAEMDAWIMHGGGQELWDEVGADFGIKHLACGNTGSQMGGWFREPMRSLDDFKGIRMRIPGYGGSVINALGGTSVTLPGPETLSALQAGTIDGTEWVGPWNDLAFGFHKVARYYHYPGFQEPGPILSLGIARSFWDDLPDNDRAIFEAVAGRVNNWSLAEFNANNGRALRSLIDEHDVEIIEFSDEIYRAMGEASRDVLADVAAGDPLAKKVHESFLDFRKKIVEWTRLSDQSFANKRQLTPF